MRTIVIIAVLLAAAPLAAQDLGVAPPGKHWRTLATPHFAVLYSEGQDSVAQRVANLAEAVHARLVPFLKWRPDGPTTVIITDNSDQANALASPLPHRTIALNLSQPLDGFGNYQDWLYEVLVHEYTHVLQTDMTDGAPAVIQSVLGRLYLPNFIQPVHQIEGLAVFTETAFTGFGRDRSAYYNGVLRSFVKAGKWLPLDRATVFSPYWPNDAPYLFGGKFFEYLAARFGNDRIARYQRQHSRLAWPFLHNWVAKEAFGTGFNVLWNDWSGRCSRFYQLQIDSISQAGVQIPAKLTTNGYDKSSLTASPDGNLLAWIEYNADEFPSLKLLDRRTGRLSLLRRGCCAGALSFSPDGRQIAFAMLNYRRYWELYYDLYCIDVMTGKQQRLTRGLRAHDPAWSPDGKVLLFVADSLGMNALATMDMASRTVRYLTAFGDSRYSHPCYSPDGSRAALSVWRPGGYQDIYTYEFATGQFQPLLVDRAQDLSPAWSADGKAVMFASDRTGIWNIFRYDLDSAKLYQATNAVGGALSPALVADRDTLCFLDLSASGFDVASMTAGRHALRAALPFSDSGRMEIGDITNASYASSRYCPLASLKPYFWFPSGFADEQGGALGIFCIGSDALTQLNYRVTVVYHGANGRPAYSIALSDARHPVTLSLALSDMAVAHNTWLDGIGTTYWERRQTQEAGASYAWCTTQWTLTPTVSYRHQRLRELNRPLPGSDPFWSGHLASFRLACLFSDAHIYGLSISPERGRVLYLESEAFRKTLGSQIGQTVAWARWSEYLALPFAHHVLVLDARLGTWRASGLSHFDDAPAFDLRGYRSGVLFQKYRATATAEYRFPLLWIERGHGTWPCYWKNLHGAIFAQAGTQGITVKGMATGLSRRSIGAELRSDWLLSYAIPAHLAAGYARAVTGPRQQTIYWSIGADL